LFDLRRVLRGSFQINLFFSGLIQIGVGSQIPTNFHLADPIGKSTKRIPRSGAQRLCQRSRIKAQGSWRYRRSRIETPGADPIGQNADPIELKQKKKTKKQPARPTPIPRQPPRSRESARPALKPRSPAPGSRPLALARCWPSWAGPTARAPIGGIASAWDRSSRAPDRGERLPLGEASPASWIAVTVSVVWRLDRSLCPSVCFQSVSKNLRWRANKHREAAILFQIL
jgi:hypothetical protein